MSVDWTPVVEAGVGALAAVIPVAAAAFSAWLIQHNHKRMAADIQAAGHVMYDTLAASQQKNPKPDWGAARQAAFADGEDALRVILGMQPTPAQLVKARGAFGAALAGDPSVSAGTSSTATATAPSGEAAAIASGAAPSAAIIKP